MVSVSACDDPGSAEPLRLPLPSPAPATADIVMRDGTSSSDEKNHRLRHARSLWSLQQQQGGVGGGGGLPSPSLTSPSSMSSLFSLLQPRSTLSLLSSWSA
jgi:hypothetical protein